MNDKKASDLIVNNLMCKTLELLTGYYSIIGEGTNPERIKSLTANFFLESLNLRIGDDISLCDIVYKSAKDNILSMLPEDKKHDYDFTDELRSLYMDGFLCGYVAGVQDMEKVLTSCIESSQQEGGGNNGIL